MISSLASKCKHFKHGGLQFYYIKWLKTSIPTLKCWHFEASVDIMTKFKSQGLYIIRIKYWNASGSGSAPSLIPAHWNIGILLHKQAKRRTIMHTTVVFTLLNIVKTKGKSSSNFYDILRKTRLYCTLRHRAVPPSLWSRGEIKWLKKLQAQNWNWKELLWIDDLKSTLNPSHMI